MCLWPLQELFLQSHWVEINMFRSTFPNQLMGAGCVYLHLDDWGFVRRDAEHRGFIIVRGELWRLVYVLHLNSDLRDAESPFCWYESNNEDSL